MSAPAPPGSCKAVCGCVTSAGAPPIRLTHLSACPSPSARSKAGILAETPRPLPGPLGPVPRGLACSASTFCSHCPALPWRLHRCGGFCKEPSNWVLHLCSCPDTPPQASLLWSLWKWEAVWLGHAKQLKTGLEMSRQRGGAGELRRVGRTGRAGIWQDRQKLAHRCSFPAVITEAGLFKSQGALQEAGTQKYQLQGWQKGTVGEKVL